MSLPTTMRSAVWYGPRDLRVEDRPVPRPGPGELLIEISRNGLCGSDLHTYLGGDTGGAAMHVPGVVLGHEFAGTVRLLGEGVHDPLPGTAVAVAPIVTCGVCFSCRRGHRNTCRSIALYGGYREPYDGGLARYASVRRECLFPIPPGLSVEDAALAEPVAVAVHAVGRAPQTLGAATAILGAGPIGLAILQIARAAGCAPIIVSEPSARRRKAAEALGAARVVDPTQAAPRRVARELASEGLALVFDTTGSSDALVEGVRLLAPHATLVSVAGWRTPAQLDMGVATAKEIDLRFSFTYEPEVDFPVALELLASRRVDPGSLVSDHVPLEDVVQSGLDALLHENDQHIKILVDPAPESP